MTQLACIQYAASLMNLLCHVHFPGYILLEPDTNTQQQLIAFHTGRYIPNLLKDFLQKLKRCRDEG